MSKFNTLKINSIYDIVSFISYDDVPNILKVNKTFFKIFFEHKLSLKENIKNFKKLKRFHDLSMGVILPTKEDLEQIQLPNDENSLYIYFMWLIQRKGSLTLEVNENNLELCINILRMLKESWGNYFISKIDFKIRFKICKLEYKLKASEIKLNKILIIKSLNFS